MNSQTVLFGSFQEQFEANYRSTSNRDLHVSHSKLACLPKRQKNDHLNIHFKVSLKPPKQSSTPLISLYFIYHIEVITQEYSWEWIGSNPISNWI